MKKYILYIVPLLMVMTGCKDGALDRYPLDAVSSVYYFKSADQLQQYTNQFYVIMPSAGSMYEEVSDLMARTTLAAEATGTRSIPADASSSSWTWGTLRHINYFLEHVDQCTDQTAKNKYIGVALFFRAYFYYDKVRRFGDVPWINHTLGNSDDELYKARDPRYVVMRNVVQDLDSAILLMPVEKSNNAYAVNRYTAMALKSRACLFEGTFCKYHNISAPDVNGMPYWKYMLKQSAAASQKLMDEGGYTLYNQGTQPYRDMFMMDDLRACSEMIMARGYDGSMALKHHATGYLTNSTDRPGFTKRMVNQYLMADGSRFTDQDKYWEIAMGPEMNNRDPRMEQTIFRPGHYTRKGKDTLETYDPTVSITGYQPIKYVLEEQYNAYETSTNDMPIFRLAEIYLNLAEAKAETGDLTQEDINHTINRLRERVGMTGQLDMSDANKTPCPYMDSLYPNVDKGDNHGVILEIRRERAVELVMEGHRYWDLMRWKEGKAFEQPYFGFSVPKVTKSKTDKSGYLDISVNPKITICIYTISHPKVFGQGIKFYEAEAEIKLSKGVEGGFVLSNGTPANLNAGRKWNEKRDYLYPLPTQEIILSKGALTQNPEW